MDTLIIFLGALALVGVGFTSGAAYLEMSLLSGRRSKADEPYPIPASWKLRQELDILRDWWTRTTGDKWPCSDDCKEQAAPLTTPRGEHHEFCPNFSPARAYAYMSAKASQYQAMVSDYGSNIVKLCSALNVPITDKLTFPVILAALERAQRSYRAEMEYGNRLRADVHKIVINNGMLPKGVRLAMRDAFDQNLIDFADKIAPPMPPPDATHVQTKDGLAPIRKDGQK